jgi:hypothetical protein
VNEARGPKLGRPWQAPTFFEQLRSEGEAECVIELIRSFARSASTRLCLLSDPRARCDRKTISTELPNLRDSCRQVGADAAASICQKIAAEDPQIETIASQLFLEALRREVWAVIHEMHSYAAGLKSQLLQSTNRKISRSRAVTDAALPGTRQGSITDLSTFDESNCIACGELRPRVFKTRVQVIRKA